MNPLPFPGPAYRIHTQRLVIRCYDPVDAPLLSEAITASLEHLKPWMPWAYFEPEELQAKIQRLRTFRARFDLGEDFVYGIFDREEKRVLGGTGLHTRVGEGAREIGYWIHADFINQGLATESSAALVRVAFEVDGVQRVEIHCDPENVRSAAVPRKLGFTHEATLRSRVPLSEKRRRDSMIWTLFKDDYPNSLAAKVPIEAFDVVGRRIL
jgi:RimJ/RimL family protein N-acetyltransferase